MVVRWVELHLGTTFGGTLLVFSVLKKFSEDFTSSEASGLYLVQKNKIKQHFKCHFQTVGFLQTLRVSGQLE